MKIKVVTIQNHSYVLVERGQGYLIKKLEKAV